MLVDRQTQKLECFKAKSTLAKHISFTLKDISIIQTEHLRNQAYMPSSQKEAIESQYRNAAMKFCFRFNFIHFPATKESSITKTMNGCNLAVDLLRWFLEQYPCKHQPENIKKPQLTEQSSRIIMQQRDYFPAYNSSSLTTIWYTARFSGQAIEITVSNDTSSMDSTARHVKPGSSWPGLWMEGGQSMSEVRTSKLPHCPTLSHGQNQDSSIHH